MTDRQQIEQLLTESLGKDDIDAILNWHINQLEIAKLEAQIEVYQELLKNWHEWTNSPEYAGYQFINQKLSELKGVTL